MAQAKRDQNFVPTLLAVSNVDGVTPVDLYADPITHRLLVDSTGGDGDVFGPESSTDNAIVRFDGTTGKLIKNSTAILDNSGNISTDGYFKSTQTATSDNFYEGWLVGDTFPRSYMEGFGSLYFGGLGNARAPLLLRHDQFNTQFANITNIDGPATILIADSDVSNPGGPNAEATFTGRVITGGGGAEFIDWFNNHYSTNGDIMYGILAQRIDPGEYRNFIMSYTDLAVSDPAGQVKNGESFYTITPTIAVGSQGGTALTGTGSITSGSAVVTGTGTAFLTQIGIGDSFAIGSEYRTVLSIASNTSLTVTADFSTTGSGLTINKFNRFRGRMGIRTHNPTAFLHLAAGIGGSTVGSASFKIDSGTLLTTPELGAIENANGYLYYSPGDGVRYSIVNNGYGVTGGQSIIGGTGPSENLLLQSTSHATRGKIILGGTALSAYDESTTRLGIGTNSPSTLIHGVATTEQLRLGYDTSNYLSITVDSTGNPTFNAIGTTPIIKFSDAIAVTADSTTVAGLTVGGGTNVGEYALSIAAGRAMLGYEMNSGALAFAGGSAKSISFYVNQTTNTFPTAIGSPAIYIQGNSGVGTVGNVGVGTGTPGSKLDVVGSFQCDSITNDTGLAAGTYTPTLTGVANVGASTAHVSQYMRVGNTITVSGQVEIDATTTLTLTQLGVSLPVASNFANTFDCGGVGNSPAVTETFAIYADAANDRAQIEWIPISTANNTFYYSFTYRVI